MKKIDKFLKYLFIVLGLMAILFAIEMLFFHYGCYDYPNNNFRGKVCGSLITNSGSHIHKILGTAFSLLLLLNIPYFIYLLLRKNGLKKSIITFLKYSIIVILTFSISVITSVVGL